MTIKKLTFEEAENALSVLTFEAKNSIKGGCGHCEGWEEEGATVYTQEEYSYLSSQSLWAGGNVCGIGYVPSQTSESETTTDIPVVTEDPVGDGMDSTIGDDPTTIPDESETTGEPGAVPTDTGCMNPACGDENCDDENCGREDLEIIDEPETPPEESETTGEPDENLTTPPGAEGEQEATPPMPPVTLYTWEEMEAMQADGSWIGGYVEGIGFVGQQTVVFPTPNLGKGYYSTFLEYMRAGTTSFWDSLAGEILGIMPGFSMFKDQLDTARQTLEGDILQAGYAADDLIYVDSHMNSHDFKIEVRAWDAITGDLISSVEAINVYGK